MQLLRRVLEGQQTERAHLNNKINDLGTQVRNLEDRLATEVRLSQLHPYNYFGGPQDT